MGLFRKAIIIGIIGVVIGFYLLRRERQLPAHYGGFVEPGFEAVELAFRQNFETGFEPDGAAFAVCHKGKMVVDIWGGYADKMSIRRWKQDTITTAFSVTKGVSSLVIALLVDRGALKYEDLVIKYWPEFGKHGKSNVTIKMLVGHEAGLVALDGAVTVEAIRDWHQMSKLFEDQVPNWPPGTVAGYHLLTHGFLCDQLVRRVDPEHRSLGTFFNEEIAKKFDIDFFIGVPRDQLYRVARMTPASFWDMFIRLDDWPYVQFLWKIMVNERSILKKAAKNPNWLEARGKYFTFNNPDNHELEIPAGNGVGSARGLAKLFCLLDGADLLSRTTIEKISKPVRISQEEVVIGVNITWGWGLWHTKNYEGNYQIGHPGYGGQNAKYDPQEHMAFAYLRNHMAPEMGELTRTFRALQHATYESVQKLRNKKKS